MTSTLNSLVSNQIPPLRDYQREAIDAVYNCWARGVQRPAVVLPTGGGKTRVFAHLIREFINENPRQRVLILAHTDELVMQAAREVKDNSPYLPIGLVKATRNDVWAQVIVASVQSLRTEKRRAQLGDIGLVIVDECHRGVAKTYRDILEHVGAFDPDSRIRTVGFTATLVRGDNMALNTVWQDVAYKKDILWMIENGYLLDVRGASIKVPDLDLDVVKKSRGDFRDGDLGRAMEKSLAPELVAEAYLEHARDRAGLAFWPTVDAAYTGADAMVAHGIKAEVIHGGLKSSDRCAILERFKAGETQVISNCSVLTEGFNAPWASAVVIARPTRSRGLFQQMAGRGLRPYEGQVDCLLLDVCGSAAHNDLRSLIDLTDKNIREVKPGQTLTDAVREAKEEVEEVSVPYRGPVVVEEFDPLVRKGRRVWNITTGGARFLTWGDQRYVFLVPGATLDMWDVAWCTKRGMWTMPGGEPRQGGFTKHRGLELKEATICAEDLVEEFGNSGSDHGRQGVPWRRRQATEKQIAMARRLGCVVADNAKGGDVSTMIDAVLASPRIDVFVNRIQEIRKNAIK